MSYMKRKMSWINVCRCVSKLIAGIRINKKKNKNRQAAKFISTYIHRKKDNFSMRSIKIIMRCCNEIISTVMKLYQKKLPGHK